MTTVLAAKTWRTPSIGCHHVGSSSKHWPCLFPQHGPGRKHERRIELGQWQQDIVDAHPGALLRGLFHSDGSRFTNTVHRPVAGGVKTYDYPRYMFGNQSRDILEICGAALDRAGIAWRYNRRNSISVARREARPCSMST